MNKSCGVKFLTDSKNFWSFVKTVKNAETLSIPHMIKDGQTFTHLVEKANILAEMFSKNSSLEDNSLLNDRHYGCKKKDRSNITH